MRQIGAARFESLRQGRVRIPAGERRQQTRMEARLALRLMVERFERVELIGAVAVNEPFILRGLTTMPIRWTLR